MDGKNPGGTLDLVWGRLGEVRVVEREAMVVEGEGVLQAELPCYGATDFILSDSRAFQAHVIQFEIAAVRSKIVR